MESGGQEERDRIEQEIQDDGTEARNIDDDEVEELHNSLKEVVQDPAVKPKFQCLMVDPSFSMVTVQSEDSGIVWETASSRCSTPWASEASSPSDSYSLEGSGTQGNIVIIMDDDKVRRRKKTSSRGKLGDRFRRPGSRLSGPAIGEERPAMIEVSVPNIRCEDSEDGQTTEGKPDKDQELFNLISEGFEILNIVVPSKLPSVDEECSTELTDNLSYLEDTPKIKTKCKPESLAPTTIPEVMVDIQEIKDDSHKGLSQTPANQQLRKDETDMDYLEKFTLLDQHAPDDESEKPEPTQDIEQEEPQVPEEEKLEDTVDENSFVIVSEVEIADDHLDEVFYGASCNAEPELPSHHKEDKEHASGSFKTLKECGSTLFGSQETILTPIFLPSGPPKIIDQDLLDEPRAMSFHYSDLYEDATGDRKKDDDASDIESVVSEKSFKRRYSDSDDGDGYLEKFILKDDTPAVEDVQEVDRPEGDRVIWPQNKFEMTGCLSRVKEDDAPEEENVGVNQTALESKHVIKDECQPSYSSKDCEDCDGLKTGCMTVKTVSETLDACEDCDMKTGCAIQKIVSSDNLPVKINEVLKTANHESDKSISIEDGKRSDVRELKHTDKQVSRRFVEEKSTELNDRLEILPQQPTDDKKVTDKAAELQETIIITKEEALNKDQQVTTTTQDISKPNLVKDIHVKDTSETTTSEETSQKKMCDSEKSEDVTKHSGEKMTVPEPEYQVKVSKAILESKSEVLQSRKIPALEEDLRDTSVQFIVPESGKQEQVTDKTMVPEVEGHSTREAESSEVETDFKTISEQKVLEELPVSEADTTEVKGEEIKLQEQTEKDTVPVFDRKTSVTDRGTIENTETVDSASAVESLNNVAKCVFPPEKKEGELGEMEKYSEIPTGYDKILEISGETKEAERDAVTLTQEIPVACPSAPEITERNLTAAVVDEEENLELAHVLNESHAEIKMISLIPATETDDSSKVTVPPPVIKGEDSEIKDVAIDRSNLETTAEALKPVYTVPADGVSKVSVQVVEGKNEGKSKKILLKDTRKEESWRTLEPASPSPPVEIQNSMRISPLEEVEYIKENDNFAVDRNIKRDKGPFSTLRSFSPLEDLSGFGRDSAEPDLRKELYEELDYEMVTEQDVRHSESEVTVGKERDQERGQDQSPEPTIEADYEFIDDLDGTQISEIRQLKEKGAIQPMDAFCLVCRCPILMTDGGHENHEVSTLEKAFEDIKNQLSNWISVLQERSENIEDMVSELELAYNSVEEQCKDGEKALDEQNEEMMKLVMERYNEMSQTMEEEKKARLEQLYDQIVSFQENTDSAKETMETATKEMEEADELEFLSSYRDIDMRLQTALDSAMSLELGPRGLLVFEDYAKGTTGNEKKNRQVIPVPQQPHLQPQEANSATSTSVTVYWTVNEGDIIDCFQVYCMEEPQGAVSEEYRVTVKESHCNLEELEPDKCYKVWVMAVNYTGCSLPSERLSFRTAPSVPVINPDACTVLWDSATIRWSSSQPSSAENFTLEYCRQYALEGEGLRSVSGIKGCEHKVLLQPNENFLFYIKSVNSAGASDQSEAALISTRGTRFHLLSETAHVALKVSEDKNSVKYPVENYNKMSELIECPAVRGELLPRVGCHYWETVVVGCKAYRIGVAYHTEPQDSTVGDSSTSWCLHCVPTSISCRFELLHDSVESDIFVTEVPARIGTLLDFTQGRLVFFNAQNGQCLGSFQHAFSQPCYPVFTLERPGNLELKMTMEVPEIAKHW